MESNVIFELGGGQRYLALVCLGNVNIGTKLNCAESKKQSRRRPLARPIPSGGGGGSSNRIDGREEPMFTM
jgi:hypothetical protein